MDVFSRTFFQFCLLEDSFINVPDVTVTTGELVDGKAVSDVGF